MCVILILVFLVLVGLLIWRVARRAGVVGGGFGSGLGRNQLKALLYAFRNSNCHDPHSAESIENCIAFEDRIQQLLADAER